MPTPGLFSSIRSTAVNRRITRFFTGHRLPIRFLNRWYHITRFFGPNDTIFRATGGQNGQANYESQCGGD